MGKPFPHPVDNFVLGDLGAWLRYHKGFNRFAPSHVGNADDGAVGDARMLH